ncbi:hypothetical protein VNO77_39695 [Canavalia gladiata]|uniref:Fe2OG dioxygenase domain-containing protein n=1 Tax=Canavalia gladiata TaxID=3824 RepID=A0AAN9PQX8_CANGL
MSKFGTSLLVPSVCELAKQPITEIPEQYLHPNQDPTVISHTTLPQAPIIDLNKLLYEDVTELEKLDHACKEWGFFQFFSLPIEEKKQFWQTPEDMEGFGQLFVKFEDQKLEWADLFFIHTLPLHTRNPRLFPSIPQPLRDNLENYSLEMKKLFITIIRSMEIALKIEPNELVELFEDLSQIMRWNYYPPCSQPENVIGLNPHSDSGVLTTLLQVNEVEGLQFKKDGKWIPIKPLPNAFVINVGDILEILTNGIYQSIEHRATINSKKERISIATSHRPQMSRVIGPTPSLVTIEKPALFKRIVVGDYNKTFFSRRLQGKSCLDDMRVQNENGK